MIKWAKVEAGEYKSTDGRFEISKTWDRIYGDHWILRDISEEDRYKGMYHENSLRECKMMAETLSK